MSKQPAPIPGSSAAPLVLAWLAVAAWLWACGREPDYPLAITGQWISKPVPGKGMAAGYLRVENRGAGAEVLLGIECADAEAVEMHQMSHEDGVMKMRKVEEWTIPGHATLVLEPEGKHLMIFGLRRQLKEGDTVPLTLRFKHAGTRPIEALVRPLR